MDFNKITEKTQTSSVKAAASVLITQQETIGGTDTEALRRATIPAVTDVILAAAGLSIVEGILCVIVEE